LVLDELDHQTARLVGPGRQAVLFRQQAEIGLPVLFAGFQQAAGALVREDMQMGQRLRAVVSVLMFSSRVSSLSGCQKV
jgi:hypothetical protein